MRHKITIELLIDSENEGDMLGQVVYLAGQAKGQLSQIVKHLWSSRAAKDECAGCAHLIVWQHAHPHCRPSFVGITARSLDREEYDGTV